MSITYPTTLDTLTNPTSSDTLDSPSHSDQHSDLNDAVEALETKVGVDSSAVTSSLDYKVNTARTGSDTNIVTGTKGTSGDLAQWNGDGDLVDGPTPPSGTIVGTSDTQTLTNKTLTSPKINEDVAITSTSTELNILDGVTADKDEINLLDDQTVLRKQTLYGSSIGVTISAGATEYVGTYKSTTSAYVGAIMVAGGGTLSNLRVYTSAAPGTDKTYVCTVMVSNVASDIVATISSASNSATDSAHSKVVTAGQFVCVRVVTTAGANTNTLNWSLLYTAD